MSKVPVAMKDYPVPKDFSFKCPFPDCPSRPLRSYLPFLSHLSGCNKAKDRTVYHCIYYFGHVFINKSERDNHEESCPFIEYGPRYNREATELKIEGNQKALFSGENSPLPPQANPNLLDQKAPMMEKRLPYIDTFQYSTIQFDHKDIDLSREHNPNSEAFILKVNTNPSNTDSANPGTGIKEFVMQIVYCRLGLNLKAETLEIDRFLPSSEIAEHLKSRRYELKDRIVCFIVAQELTKDHVAVEKLWNSLKGSVAIIERPNENEVGIIFTSETELIYDIFTTQVRLPFKRSHLFYLCVVPYAQFAETIVLKQKESYFFSDMNLEELNKKMKEINLGSESQQKTSDQDSSQKLQKEIREILDKIRREEKESAEKLKPLDEQIEELEKQVSIYRAEAYNLKKEENRLKQKESMENTQRAKADQWLKLQERQLKEKIKEEIALEEEGLILLRDELKNLEDSRKGREETKKDVAKLETEITALRRTLRDKEGKMREAQKGGGKSEWGKGSKDDYLEELLCTSCKKKLRMVLYLPCKCLWKCRDCHNVENPFKTIQCGNCKEPVKETVIIKRPDNLALCEKFLQNFPDPSQSVL